MPVDTYSWDNRQKRSEDFWSSECYDFLLNGIRVGKCSTEVHRRLKAERGLHQYYPNSWFIGDSRYLKPVLDVPSYSCEQYKHQGIGRAGLQELYKLSCQKGCGGRIHLLATNGAGGFYEHCGFSGLNINEDGYKYFDPLPENISKLFSKKTVSIQLVRTFKQKEGVPFFNIDPVLLKVEKYCQRN